MIKKFTITVKNNFVKVFFTISTNHVSATAGTAIAPVTITNTGGSASYYSISPAIRNGP
jgi:hypothetical protein